MGKEKNLMERLPLDALSQIFCSIHKLRDVLSLSTCSRRLRKASMNWRVWESCYRVYFGSLKGPLQFGTAVFLSHATSFRATSKAMFAAYYSATRGGGEHLRIRSAERRVRLEFEASSSKKFKLPLPSHRMCLKEGIFYDVHLGGIGGAFLDALSEHCYRVLIIDASRLPLTYADASYDLILCVGDQPPSHCFWASAADPEMGVVQPDRITFVKEASELAILDAVFENIHPLAPRAPSLVPSGCLLPFQPLLNLFLG